MTEGENIFEQTFDPIDTRGQKARMRRAFSRVGWAVLALTVATNVVSLAFGIILVFLGDTQLAFFSDNLLYFNELIVALSVLAGALVLIGMPTCRPSKRKAGVGEFLVYLCICFAIGWVGNFIGNTMLGVWNSTTGNEVTNQLAEVLSLVDPWQMAICTGLFAPILEELFFRKLIIDRTRRYGELASILISAAFFGIFHQNFSQFFYAFGIGILLGYVYCRTGSYLTVTLLHIAFNVIMGVLPSLMAPDVLAFLEEYVQIDAANAEAMMELIGEYAAPLLMYLAYILIQGALSIAGVILLIVMRKRIYLERNSMLSPAEQRKAAIVNFGVIAAFLLLIGLTVNTLFTA